MNLYKVELLNKTQHGHVEATYHVVATGKHSAQLSAVKVFMNECKTGHIPVLRSYYPTSINVSPEGSVTSTDSVFRGYLYHSELWTVIDESTISRGSPS